MKITLDHLTQPVLVLLTVMQTALAIAANEPTPATIVDNPALDKYVDFIRQHNQKPVDYILGLFQTNELVILCERSHPETTQYDFIYQLVSDPRFIQNVGHIFTELGTVAVSPRVESFLTSEGLTEEQVQHQMREIFRNFSEGVGWGRPNIYDFMRRLYSLNRDLPKEKKVLLHPSDVSFRWENATQESLAAYWQQMGQRDKIMADNISAKFNCIRRSLTRNKALVIMNFRHAFPHLKMERGGKSRTIANTGGYLMAAYPGTVANVLINNVRIMPGSSDNQAVISAVQDGKWDAAFAVLENRSVGFDFQGSPFGADAFDYFPFPIPTGHRYQDVFTGFVFFKPLAEHQMAFGVPGLLDAPFASEMLRRYRLTGKNPSPDEIEQEIKQSSKVTTFGYENKSLFPKSDFGEKIQKWLK